MYTYKTEILTVSTKWFSDKASAEDTLMLDKLINERASDGWELVTYDYRCNPALHGHQRNAPGQTIPASETIPGTDPQSHPVWRDGFGR